MKNRLLTLLTLLFLTCHLAAQTATAPIGSGTSIDPYQIATLDNLYWVTQNSSSWGSYFIQTANIDASSTTSWDGGQGFLPIGNYYSEFTGSYDGQNYTISGLYINRSSDYVGFFGATSAAKISNLGITGVNITGQSYTGAMVGRSYNGSTISNSHTTGTITSNNTYSSKQGGFIGEIIGGTQVTNSYSTCTVNSSGSTVGGFSGRISDNAIVNACYSTGAVNGKDFTGGFTGIVEAFASITNCYSLGSVSRNSGQLSGFFGAFCGANGPYNFYSGTDAPGGDIKNCYATGDVIYIDATNPTDKGFSGHTGNYGGVNYVNNFFDSEASNQNSDGLGAAAAKTTMEMKHVYTFTNTSKSTGLSSPVWDFVSNPNEDAANNDYWDMDQDYSVNSGYPILSWQNGADNVIGEYSGGGTGTSTDPFLIGTLSDLQKLSISSSDWNAYFKQTADIDASATSGWNADGNGGYYGFDPIGSGSYFSGEYDGQNYKINNLYINRTAENYVGFFSNVRFLATLKNIKLENLNVTGASYIGGLAGNIDSAITISQCRSTGSINGTTTIGGLIGRAFDNCSVSNSYSSVNISGSSILGGLIGSMQTSVTINNSFAAGNMSGGSQTGGFVGEKVYSTISNCYATGAVTRNSGSTATDIAAFCGSHGKTDLLDEAGGTIEYSYATGSVTYSGAVSPTDKGFIGIEYVDFLSGGGNTYTNNFFDSQTTGQSSDAVGGGTAKTTAEMQNVATFTDAANSAGLSMPVWDFVTNPNDDSGTNDYWEMDQAGTVNNGYPILSWQPGADQTLPVNLAAFSATPGDGQVLLRWTTASEVNNQAFRLERSEDDGQTFALIAEIEGQGNKNSRTDYSYRDPHLFNGVTYHYRLSDVDYNGRVTPLQTVSVTPHSAVNGETVNTIVDFNLYPAYPNPFNPQTTFGFDLPERSAVTLAVYDLHGKRVRELVSGERESGVYKITFDASRLASGVYFYRFTARGLNSGRMFSRSRRVMLIK